MDTENIENDRLQARVDALQAENERLREAFDNVCSTYAHDRKALQARVTLLEGLLRQASSDLAESSGYATSDGGLDFLMEIDAALSRSDADG